MPEEWQEVKNDQRNSVEKSRAENEADYTASVPLIVFCGADFTGPL